MQPSQAWQVHCQFSRTKKFGALVNLQAFNAETGPSTQIDKEADTDKHKKTERQNSK